MGKLEKRQSAVVEKTLSKRSSTISTRSTLGWGALNLLLALVIYIDITYGRIASLLVLLTHPLVMYAEWGLVGLFFFNGVFDILRYLGSTLSASPVELTLGQKALLGVRESEAGFRLARPQTGGTLGGNNSSLIISPSTYTSHQSSPSFLSFNTQSGPWTPSRTPNPPSRTPSPLSRTPSPNSRSHSPLSRTPSPPHYNYSPGSMSSNSSSYLHNSPSPRNFSVNNSLNHSLSHSLNHSYHSRSGTASPVTPNTNQSPLFRENQSPLFRESFHDTSGGLRSRVNVSRSSPLASDDCITDVRAFDHYLREQNQKEYRTQIVSPDSSSSSGPSFWNYNRSVIDYAPVLRKYQYQMASRDPQAITSRDNDPDHPATYHGHEVWSKMAVHRDEVEKWTENLRKWLSQTIFVRVSKEIKSINKTLARIGSEDMKIGEVSISTLKQLAVTKAVHVPTLNTILPFLEASTNQDYLVTRIHELAKGGCLHEFKWDGGSDFKGKAWQESQPTDCEIVMHLLCSYMDSRLPPHPKYPDGKTFTSQVFIKTPDKPDLSRKSPAVIYQSRLHPPHYKLVLGGEVWDVTRGRNNLFQALLLFLYHIQTKEHGMLGRVNLGLSGVNVLWVLEK